MLQADFVVILAVVPQESATKTILDGDQTAAPPNIEDHARAG
jgi:hypothetical protein